MRPSDIRLAPGQERLIEWAASLGAVTAQALALRDETSIASARARLNAAKRSGLLACERPLARRPALFTVTRAGLRAGAMTAIDPCRVSPSNAHHLIVCAAVAAALERCYPDHAVVGERELRALERERGGPLASARFYGPQTASGLHRPDLVLWPVSARPSIASRRHHRDGDGHACGLRNGYLDGPPPPPPPLPVAVEVELTAKSPRRLTEICRAWGRCRLVCGVLYLAPAAVERAVTRAIATARADEQVVVVPLSALAGVEQAATAA